MIEDFLGRMQKKETNIISPGFVNQVFQDRVKRSILERSVEIYNDVKWIQVAPDIKPNLKSYIHTQEFCGEAKWASNLIFNQTYGLCLTYSRLPSAAVAKMSTIQLNQLSNKMKKCLEVVGFKAPGTLNNTLSKLWWNNTE